MLIIKINSEYRFKILKNEYYKMNNLNFLFELLIHIKRHNNVPGLKNEAILAETEINERHEVFGSKNKPFKSFNL